MIDKLYNLKKLQTDQKILQRQQLLSNIAQIEEDISSIQKNQFNVSIQGNGAMGDFSIVQMHRNTMIHNIQMLNERKKHLQIEVDSFNKEIIELQKESEQFEFIKNEMKIEEYKKRIKEEEIASSEYMQVKWMER